MLQKYDFYQNEQQLGEINFTESARVFPICLRMKRVTRMKHGYHIAEYTLRNSYSSLHKTQYNLKLHHYFFFYRKTCNFVEAKLHPAMCGTLSRQEATIEYTLSQAIYIDDRTISEYNPML